MASLNGILLSATDSLQGNLSVTSLIDGVAQNLASAEMNEQDLNLGTASTPPIEKRALFSQTMAGAPVTLNLTSLTDTYLGTVDLSNGGGTGGATSAALRPQFLKIINKGANILVIEPGASNPYYFDAADTTYKIVLPAGASVKFRLNDAAEAVSATNKTIKLTGTYGDVYWILIYAG